MPSEALSAYFPAQLQSKWDCSEEPPQNRGVMNRRDFTKSLLAGAS